MMFTEYVIPQIQPIIPHVQGLISSDFLSLLSIVIKLTNMSSSQLDREDSKPYLQCILKHFSCQSAILMKDNDMMVDAALFLWLKCKPHFQRILSSSLENCKQLLNEVFVNRVSHLKLLTSYYSDLFMCCKGLLVN